MEISEQQIFPTLEAELTFLAPASPVSRRVWPGNEEARSMTVGSGRQLSMLLDSSSPLGACSKILLESSQWASSEEFCYVWQLWDTGLPFGAYQLTPLALNTEDNGSLLWQTPRHEGFDAGCHRGKADSLHAQAKNPKLWQTPVRDDAIDRVNGKINSRGEPKLSAQAKLWPTPQAHDAAKGDPERVGRFGTKHGGRNLTDEVMVAGLSGSGSLNPRFVEELMGFPIDHTALKPSGTPSVRSRRIRSSTRSRRLKEARYERHCG
jgi:hypothetical protein